MIWRAVQRGGLVGGVEMEEVAAVVPEDDEGEEQAEGEGGHEEKVDGDDVSGVRDEKGAPRRRRSR